MSALQAQWLPHPQWLPQPLYLLPVPIPQAQGVYAGLTGQAQYAASGARHQMMIPENVLLTKPNLQKKLIHQEKKKIQGVVAHAFNSSICGAEASRSL